MRQGEYSTNDADPSKFFFFTKPFQNKCIFSGLYIRTELSETRQKQEHKPPVDIRCSKQSVLELSIIRKKGFFHSQSHSHARVVSNMLPDLSKSELWLRLHLFHCDLLGPLHLLLWLCMPVIIIPSNFELVANYQSKLNDVFVVSCVQMKKLSNPQCRFEIRRFYTHVILALRITVHFLTNTEYLWEKKKSVKFSSPCRLVQNDQNCIAWFVAAEINPALFCDSQ